MAIDGPIKKFKSSWMKILKQIPMVKVNQECSQPDYDFLLLRTAQCPCGNHYPFYSQMDHEPEYYTTITLECECGNFLVMKFPVN